MLYTSHGVVVEMTGPNYSSCDEPGSVMWLATRQFHNPCCQAETSQWEINYTVTIEYLINCQILDLISYGITEKCIDIFWVNFQDCPEMIQGQ